MDWQPDIRIWIERERETDRERERERESEREREREKERVCVVYWYSISEIGCDSLGCGVTNT